MRPFPGFRSFREFDIMVVAPQVGNQPFVTLTGFPSKTTACEGVAGPRSQQSAINRARLQASPYLTVKRS